MNDRQLMEVSYFPGCSLATSARESNISLMEACKILGLDLIELKDWNCCGSSSAACLDKDLSFFLSARNLSLAPAGRPLMAMCPSCLKHLRQAQLRFEKEPEARRAQERRWGRPIAPDLEVVHFMEVLVRLEGRLKESVVRSLNGLKFVPYYGCSLFRPPAQQRRRYYQGEMEHILTTLGGHALNRVNTYRCCGSFLSAARADVVTPLVNEIVTGAVTEGAECMVTSCAMCQLNLEIRCTWEPKIPIFHFSEILALALGATDYEGWFTRHLVDPRPLLKARGLIP